MAHVILEFSHEAAILAGRQQTGVVLFPAIWWYGKDARDRACAQLTLEVSHENHAYL